jgi:hypothetical protein
MVQVTWTLPGMLSPPTKAPSQQVPMGGMGPLGCTWSGATKGQTIMTGDILRDEQFLSIAQNASPCVPTVLVCHNTLIRSGISHILSGTQFVISDQPVEQASEMPALCLIHADRAAGELTETIERVKAQWPIARAVLFTEHMEPAAMVQAMQSGLDGHHGPTRSGNRRAISSYKFHNVCSAPNRGRRKVKMSHRSKRGMSHSPDGRAWEFGMGWVETSKRDLRRAGAGIDSISWWLSFFYEVLGCSCGFIPDDTRQVAGHVGC